MKRTQETVQSFLGIADIRNGVIAMQDGRFLKLLELEPVGLFLRTPEEVGRILSSFAAWLRIAPDRLHFKCMTFPADTDSYADAFESDLEQEKHPACRSLGQVVAESLRKAGERGVLCTRFLLILTAQERGADAAAEELESVAATAREYLGRCGNRIVEADDPDAATAELLYRDFNRNHYRAEPFSDRVWRMVCECGATAKPETVPVGTLIGPRGIDLTHRNWFLMDGRYHTVLYLQGDGYPARLGGGWLSALVGLDDGIDVDLHLTRENRAVSIGRIARRLRLMRSRQNGMEDSARAYDGLTNAIDAAYYLKAGLAGGDELFRLAVLITVSADRKEVLRKKTRLVTERLTAMDFSVSACPFCQEQAWSCVLPTGIPDVSVLRKAERNVLGDGASSAYPLIGFREPETDGIPLGLRRETNTLFALNLFDERRNPNANLCLLGTSGAGKTFTLQLLALRMRMRGIPCFLIAPIKGHEFRCACERVGGSFVRLAPGSANAINPMELRLGEGEQPQMALAGKVQWLMRFFSLLMPDLSGEEEQLLDAAILQTYRDFGMPCGDGKQPILANLLERLQSLTGTARIVRLLERFVSGSARIFNQQTNVDLSSSYVVLDLSGLDGKLLAPGMMIALDLVWSRVKADIRAQKAVFIDEIWRLVGASSTREAAEFCLTVFKTIRGYGGAAIAATQELSDFFGLEDGRYGRAILNNSAHKLLLRLEPNEAADAQKALGLTDAERLAVINLSRGEALLDAPDGTGTVRIYATQPEEILLSERNGYDAVGG